MGQPYRVGQKCQIILSHSIHPRYNYSNLLVGAIKLVLQLSNCEKLKVLLSQDISRNHVSIWELEIHYVNLKFFEKKVHNTWCRVRRAVSENLILYNLYTSFRKISNLRSYFELLYNINPQGHSSDVSHSLYSTPL